MKGDAVSGGCFLIGDRLYTHNSSYLTMLGIFLWPYINRISPCITDNIYRYFLFRDESLDFTQLTSKTYMLCYQRIRFAFERDLYDFPFLRGHNYAFALREWREKLRPMFTASKLYDEKLVGIQATMDDFLELHDYEDYAVKDEINIAKENRPGMKIAPSDEPVNWDIYPNEYCPVLWNFFDKRYETACDLFDVFFDKYGNEEQIAVASLVARLMILKAKYEKELGLDYSSTYERFLNLYSKRFDESIKYLYIYYEQFLLANS